MDILVGSTALVKLYHYYTGDNIDIIPRDTDYLSTNNTRTKKGVDYIRLSRCEYLNSLTDLINYEELVVDIDGELVASPLNLMLTYFGRRIRFGYNSLKVCKDVHKIRLCYTLFQDQDLELFKILEDNGRYKDDWTLHCHNDKLFYINFIQGDLVIANDFAIMFYFEQFLNREYEYGKYVGSLEAYGNYISQPSLNYRFELINKDCEYNEFDIHKHFKIESINSLLSKYHSDQVSSQLRYIQNTFNLK